MKRHLKVLNKKIIGWGFCDIQNNQGRGRGYQPKSSAEADNPYWDLDYFGYHKNWNLIIVLLCIGQKKWKSCFCFFTDGKQQSAQTWHNYPWKSCTAVIHDMIIHDLECPWHDNCIICSYDFMGADFENSLYAFSQSEKSYRVQCLIIFVVNYYATTQAVNFWIPKSVHDTDSIIVLMSSCQKKTTSPLV